MSGTRKCGALISGALLLFLSGSIAFAEGEKKEEEKKIRLEKVQVIGVLEKPAVVFPIRWQDPDAPAERPGRMKRSFREEIFDQEESWEYSGD